MQFLICILGTASRGKQSPKKKVFVDTRHSKFHFLSIRVERKAGIIPQYLIINDSRYKVDIWQDCVRMNFSMVVSKFFNFFVIVDQSRRKHIHCPDWNPLSTWVQSLTRCNELQVHVTLQGDHMQRQFKNLKSWTNDDDWKNVYVERDFISSVWNWQIIFRVRILFSRFCFSLGIHWWLDLKSKWFWRTDKRFWRMKNDVYLVIYFRRVLTISISAWVTYTFLYECKFQVVLTYMNDGQRVIANFFFLELWQFCYDCNTWNMFMRIVGPGMLRMSFNNLLAVS